MGAGCRVPGAECRSIRHGGLPDKERRDAKYAQGKPVPRAGCRVPGVRLGGCRVPGLHRPGAARRRASARGGQAYGRRVACRWPLVACYWPRLFRFS
jgi:hypothetical protein